MDVGVGMGVSVSVSVDVSVDRDRDGDGDVGVDGDVDVGVGVGVPVADPGRTVLLVGCGEVCRGGVVMNGTLPLGRHPRLPVSVLITHMSPGPHCTHRPVSQSVSQRWLESTMYLHTSSLNSTLRQPCTIPPPQSVSAHNREADNYLHIHRHSTPFRLDTGSRLNSRCGSKH